MHRSLWLVACAALIFAVACDLADTTDPDVTIVVPANGATLGPGNVTIKAVATDDNSVDKVTFYAGATEIGEDGTGSNDTFDISWTAAVGTYTLKAVAADPAGNEAEHTIIVTIQTGGGGTGPTITRVKSTPTRSGTRPATRTSSTTTSTPATTSR
jgi:hypothetical protein